MSNYPPQGQAVATASIAFSAGMSTLGNTQGIAGTVSRELILVGGNNITLSQNIVGQTATITIDAVTASLAFSAGMSTMGNTQGTAGTVSRELILVGGNNVTLSQNIVGQTATVTIDVVQSIQPGIQSIYAGTTNITTGKAIFLDSNSISFGVDGQTVTASYDLISHNSVYHTGIIGAESQISFNTLSGHDHDGTNSRQIIIPEYVEVSKTELGKSRKQFTSVAAAIASITDASATKPYVIRVYPGIYAESPFSMKSYVDIIGSGMYDTIIETNDNTQHFITGASISLLRNCAITGPTDNYKAAIYYAEESPLSPKPSFIVQDVLLRAGYYGIYTTAVTNEALLHVINVANWYIGIPMHTFMYATGRSIIVAMNSSYMCNVANAITRGFVADSSTAQLYLDVCAFRCRPTGSNIIDALFLDNGATARVMACTFSRGTNAIRIGSNGTGGSLTAISTIIRLGTFTTDIWMENFGLAQFTGACTKSKITVNPHATLSANFTDLTTGEEGTVTYGEMWLGTNATNSIPLRDYGLTAYSSGWKSGGAVTRSGAYPSLDVAIALGNGYINTGIGVTKIIWGATTKTCTANTTQWVYIDTAGTVTISASEPNYPDVIMLAITRTSDDHVTFLANHNILLHQTVPTTYEYIEKVFGSTAVEGCIVTKHANPSLKVDFATGKYFSGLQELQPAWTLGTPITFTYWYRKVLSSGWNCVTPGGIPIGSDFDTTRYDDNSGTLASLPPNKYKKDLLYVVKNDVGTEFHVIYGQEYFDTSDLAETVVGFEIPDAFIDDALKLDGIVVLANAADIYSIIDEKSKFVYEHNELIDLQGGQAKQYYHLNYNEWSSRDQKIVASIAGNITSVGAGYALISTGTMYLAGGNNITLSQNANSVTISGANIAISGSNATLAATMFMFGNTNGLSFQINNGSMVGSIDNFITSQSNQALQGSNGSFTFQTATFGNANGLSFYTDNGSMVGSFDAVKNLNGSSGTMSISANSTNNISISNDANTINVINLLSTSNTVYNVGSASSSGTGSSRFAMYDHIHAGIGGFGVSNTGTTLGDTGTKYGTFVLAASGNITASQSTNIASPGVNTIWFSVPEQTDQPRIVLLNGTSGNLSLVGASNITVAPLNGSTITIYGPESVLSSLGLSGHSITDGSNGITGGGFILAGGNSITLSQSNNTISIHGSQSVQTENLHALVVSNGASNPTTIGTSGTVSFAGTNVTITAAANNSVIGFSVANQLAAAESNWINLQGNTNAGSNSTASGSTIMWSAGNNITLAATNGSVVRIDAGLSAGIGGIGITESSNKFLSGTVIFSALTNVTIFTSSNGDSQYIQISAPNPIAGNVVKAISGSNGFLTNETVTFGNSNGLSFYTVAGNSFVGSYTVPIINGSSSTLTISAGNNINISNDASTINIINILTAGIHAQPVNYSTYAGLHDSLFAKDDHIHRGLAQFQISGTNTSNTSNIVYGSLVLAGGNSITLSQISALGGATVTISGPQFNNANNVTFGSAAGIITATVTLPSIGALNGSSGTMSISANSTNNISISNDANTINVINLLSTSNTVYNVGSASSSGTGSSRFAMYDHIHAGAGGFGVSNTGTTLGDTGTKYGTFVLAASGNITASQSTNIASPGVNTIWFSVPVQTTQTQNLHALLVSNNTSGPFTIGTSGTVSFAGTNITITADIANSSIIGFSVAGIQGIAGSNLSTATAGTVQFQNSNGITFGLNGNIITASHDGLTSQSTAPSGLYATNIATTFTSGIVGFSGSNNITVSTAAQAIIISGPNTHAQQTGISSLGATDATYTSGGVILYGSGIVSISSTTGQGFVISAPGVISLNGYSSNVTISAGNLMSIDNNVRTINIINLLSSATTASSITSVNVIGANVSRFALEGHQHAGVRAAGVSSGGNISGNTAVLPGQLVLAGGNNITLSQITSNNNNMTITISGANVGVDATLPIWPMQQMFGMTGSTLDTGSSTVGTFGTRVSIDYYVYPIIFPVAVTATAINIVQSMTASTNAGNSAANTFGISLGIYSDNAGKLSLMSSFQNVQLATFSSTNASYRLFTGTNSTSDTTGALTGGQIYSSFTGLRAVPLYIDIKNIIEITAGLYWAAVGYSMRTANRNYVSTLSIMHAQTNSNNFYISNIWTASNALSPVFYPRNGYITAALDGSDFNLSMPDSFDPTDISAGNSSFIRSIPIFFRGV